MRIVRRVRSWAAGVLLFALAGGGDDDGVGGSVLDAVEPSADDYTGTRRELASLIVGPASLGKYQLIYLRVDDPNGNGRIDGRWYPPRVRSGDCLLDVDSAPIPTAAASFVPGDPAELLSNGDDALATVDHTWSAEHVISIQVQIFDQAEQRDEMAATMLEFYPQSATFACGDDPGLLDRFEAEWAPLAPHQTGFPGAAFAISSIMGSSVVMQYEVGDRILLTVVADLGTQIAFGRDDTDIDPALVDHAIDVELQHLEAAMLPQ